MGAQGRGTTTGGVAARLRAARSSSFVGRRGERDLFAAALADEVPPFVVLHVHGPGGIGKTALLHQLAEDARGAGRHVVWLDGREVDPSPEGLRTHLAATASVAPDEVVDALARTPELVLLVDTYESLAPVDGWVRDHLLPQLGQDALVVLAGRRPPTTAWRDDAAWSELLRVVSLRDLAAEDARALLDARGVVPDRHAEALRVARGHPLALVLAAEVLGQQPEDPLELDHPVVVEGLLARVLRDVPSADHRRGLEAAAHVGIATEALVRDVVGDAAGAVFDWLRQRSWTEPTTTGIAVHDVVCDALNAELRWRDPDTFVEVHRHVTSHLERRIARSAGAAQHHAMLDLLQLYRLHPVTRPFYDWGRTHELWPEPAAPADRDAVVALTRDHEGDTAADIAAWWFDRQPEAFTVFRGHEDDEARGFVANVLLGDTPGPEVDADPVAAAAWEHVRSTGPVREGERIRVMRFWIARETHQGIATHHLVSARTSLDWLATEGLAWAFTVVHDPDFYEPIFTFIDFTRPPGLEVTIDDHTVALFARDWRVTSRRDWRRLLEDRRTGREPATPPKGETADRLLVLAHDDFVEAVRDALRGVARPRGLVDNPLLRSRVVAEVADGRPPEDVLAALLAAATADLDGHPRDEVVRRVVELTWLDPAPTQEAAAERLDLPFSTYRRHLARGTDHVAAWLWERELHGHRR